MTFPGRLSKLLLVVVLSAGLAGCFTSDGPLITVEEADFPFQTIIFSQEGEQEQINLQRQSIGYVGISDDAAPITFLFKRMSDDLFLVQVSGESEDEGTQYLYGALLVDLEAQTAKAYATIADESEIPAEAGLSFCGRGLVCLTDLDAYTSFVQGVIARGAEPDLTYTIVRTE